MNTQYTVCIFKFLFNIKCLGCGTTRAIWYLIHLDLDNAIKYNQFVVITFPLLSYIVLKWIIKDKKISI
ncbi:DUF2752 domain-containing protein [Leptospira soteropolitanensis]